MHGALRRLQRAVRRRHRARVLRRLPPGPRARRALAGRARRRRGVRLRAVAARARPAPQRALHRRHRAGLRAARLRARLAAARRAGSGRDRPGPAPAAAPPRPGWVLAGWAVACWQLTLGFAVGLPFAWALAIVLAVAGVTGLRAGAAGAAARGLPALAAAARGGRRRRARVRRHRRAADDPVPSGGLRLPGRQADRGDAAPLLAAGARPRHRARRRASGRALQDGWRSSMDAVQEQALLPGFALHRCSRWSACGTRRGRVRHRVLLGAGTVVTTLLCLGTSGPCGGEYTYLPLFRHVPGWEALRTPGRLVLWVTLCLGLLAAGAVTRLVEDAARRRATRAATAGAWRRRVVLPAGAALLLLPATAVTAEGTSHMTYPRVPEPADRARGAARSPLMVLPTVPGRRLPRDDLVAPRAGRGWPTAAAVSSRRPRPSCAGTLRGFPTGRASTRCASSACGPSSSCADARAGTPGQEAAERPTAGLPRHRPPGAGARGRRGDLRPGRDG